MFGDLLKITQLITGGAQIQTQVVWLTSKCMLSESSR